MKKQFFKKNLFGKIVYSINNGKKLDGGYREVSISKIGRKWKVVKTDGNYMLEDIKQFNSLTDAKIYSLILLTK